MQLGYLEKNKNHCLLQLTPGLLFTQGINIDSVLRVYTIASVCQAARLQEMEFSSKASMYLPDRNAAASASPAPRGRREDTVCPRTPERRGKPLSREAAGTYGQRGHVEIRRGGLGAAAGRAGNPPAERLGNFWELQDPDLHHVNYILQISGPRQKALETTHAQLLGYLLFCPHADIFLEQNCLDSGMECLYWGIFLSWFLCK